MNLTSSAFVQNLFRHFYIHDYAYDGTPPMIDEREFGFASFEGWMLRHRSFRDGNELKNLLLELAPSDAYCSCAYYEDPEADMNQKSWLGGDLVFDIDADHLEAACCKTHDLWKCTACSMKGKGEPPTECPSCRQGKIRTQRWTCKTCLDTAKRETLKLLNILFEDFGFSGKETRTFFSGHRGFHVYVEDEAIRSLDSTARKEIVDYVIGLGLNLSSHLPNLSTPRQYPHANSLNELGWSKRIISGIENLLHEADEADLEDAGLKRSGIRKMLQYKHETLRKCLEQGRWRALKGIGPETWTRMAEKSVKLQAARVDTVVTTDIHRLIRLPDTLHGKTGLRKVEFSQSELFDSDPFTSAIAFHSGEAIVLVSDAPEFSLGERTFGPYKSQRVELPTAAATFLICKGRAEVAEHDLR